MRGWGRIFDCWCQSVHYFTTGLQFKHIYTLLSLLLEKIFLLHSLVNVLRCTFENGIFCELLLLQYLYLTPTLPSHKTLTSWTDVERRTDLYPLFYRPDHRCCTWQSNSLSRSWTSSPPGHLCRHDISHTFTAMHCNVTDFHSFTDKNLITFTIITLKLKLAVYVLFSRQTQQTRRNRTCVLCTELLICSGSWLVGSNGQGFLLLDRNPSIITLHLN